MTCAISFHTSLNLIFVKKHCKRVSSRLLLLASIRSLPQCVDLVPTKSLSRLPLCCINTKREEQVLLHLHSKNCNPAWTMRKVIYERSSTYGHSKELSFLKVPPVPLILLSSPSKTVSMVALSAPSPLLDQRQSIKWIFLPCTTGLKPISPCWNIHWRKTTRRMRQRKNAVSLKLKTSCQVPTGLLLSLSNRFKARVGITAPLRHSSGKFISFITYIIIQYSFIPFFRRLRDITLENDVLMIVDEVQTGCGATGKMWAHDHWGLKTPPDMVTFAKKFQAAGMFHHIETRPSETYR